MPCLLHPNIFLAFLHIDDTVEDLRLGVCSGAQVPSRYHGDVEDML